MKFIIQYIKLFIKRNFSVIEKAPIFILGNQKSGTSITVELLGKCTGLSYVNDFTEMYEPVQSQLHNGTLDLKTFIQTRARIPFSNKIIKEPGLTFLYHQLSEVYKNARYLFVVRDPRDNIRSILNRVNVRGDLESLDVYSLDVIIEWKKILDNHWLGIDKDHYIESMAERWNLAVEKYLSNQNIMVLLKYEDFLKNKSDAINKAAISLGLNPLNDIHSFVDTQYQSKGDRTISWPDFFGETNLKRIELLCKHNMIKLGYEI